MAWATPRFELGEPRLSADTFTPGGSLTVSVEVRNVGARAGSEVVQCYVAPEAPRLPRPPKELKAFAKRAPGAGESAEVELRLDDRSFAYWDPGQADWEQAVARFTQISPQMPPTTAAHRAGRSTRDATRCSSAARRPTSPAGPELEVAP